MATPREPSPQGMNTSRDMRRSFLGGRNGRTGLSPVKRTSQPPAVRAPAASPGGGLLPYNYVILIATQTTIGTNTNFTTLEVSSESGDTSWDASTASSLTVGADGVYSIAAELSCTTDPGAGGSLFLNQGAGNFQARFPLLKLSGLTKWAAQGVVTVPMLPSQGGPAAYGFYYAGATATISGADLVVRVSRVL